MYYNVSKSSFAARQDVPLEGSPRARELLVYVLVAFVAGPNRKCNPFVLRELVLR